MHSHDSEIGIVPSIQDIAALRNAKSTSSLLFTSKGILSYTWNKDFDVLQKFESFLELKYGKENIRTEDDFYTLDKTRQVEVLTDFYKAFDVITHEATWEDKERSQQILDGYFHQAKQ